MPKKKGFLNYGKEDEEPADDKEDKDDSEDSDASGMRLMHLAEKTGVEDPKALIKLIKACMQEG